MYSSLHTKLHCEINDENCTRNQLFSYQKQTLTDDIINNIVKICDNIICLYVQQVKRKSLLTCDGSCSGDLVGRDAQYKAAQYHDSGICCSADCNSNLHEILSNIEA